MDKLTTQSNAPDDLEQFEHHQSLAPGYYWRAARDLPARRDDRQQVRRDIPAGEVLLLVEVALFDGVEHTVVLQYHPRHGEGQHRLLVEDFLAAFRPELDGEQVRQQEIAAIHGDVASLQEEITRGQVDPTVMAPAIEAGLREWLAHQAEDDAEGEEGVGAAPENAVAIQGASFRTDVGFALDNRLSPADTRAMYQIAEREAKIAQLRADWLTERTTAIAEKLEALAPFYAEKSAVALARISGIRQQADEIMKGIASLDLYTGKNVTVETLREGAGAEAAAPLTLMQRKLIVEEELAAWAPVGEDFDFHDLERFDEAVAANADLRDQLLPTERCVVAMAIRRQDLDYGDAFANQAKNRLNRQMFLLIRNGDNLYRVYSGEPTHEAAPRLFPASDEFEGLFRGVDGSRITYRDIQFAKQASRVEDLSLHYRRLLILLCGLDHRLQLFGAFYPAEEASQFITLGFQQRHLRFLADEEDERLLGEGRPAVAEWIASRNAYLRSGSRVLCLHRDLLTPETAPAVLKDSPGGRFVDHLAHPLAPSETLIAYREGAELCVSVPVVRDTWRDVRNEEFNARVSLTKALADSLRPGVLCLDAVTAADLEWYIHDRSSRIRHITYMRLFKQAAEALRAEEAAEREVRDYLRQSALEAGLADVTTVDAKITESVWAWRADRRGAPLPAVGDKKALTGLLDHLFAQDEQVSQQLVARAEAYAHEQGLTPLKVALNGRSSLSLYVEVPPEERSDRLVTWGWVRRLRMKPLKTKLQVTSSRLVWLGEEADASEKVLKEWPALEGWRQTHAEPVKPKAIDQYCEVVRLSLPGACELFTGEGQGIPEPAFERLLDDMETVMRGGGKMVQDPGLAIPVAAYAPSTSRHGVTPFHVMLWAPAEQWLHHFADDEQRLRLRQRYLGVYARPEAHVERFDRPFSPRLGMVRARKAPGLVIECRWDYLSGSKGKKEAWSAFLEAPGDETLAAFKSAFFAGSGPELALVGEPVFADGLLDAVRGWMATF